MLVFSMSFIKRSPFKKNRRRLSNNDTSTASLALTNGGSAGLIYTWLVAWAGFNAVYASMAEMASLAPTTGGQYHWVSEFAPPGYQAFLSYVVGK